MVKCWTLYAVTNNINGCSTFTDFTVTQPPALSLTHLKPMLLVAVLTGSATVNAATEQDHIPTTGHQETAEMEQLW
jgi:hypothetical protein